MKYTIKKVAERMNLTPSTIRYYDKEGLLPFIERKASGYRLFAESDIQMLLVIDCLKRTRMPLKDIKTFTDWVKAGDCSLQERYDMFLERKQAIEDQMAELQKSLELIDHKCRYYKTALEAGTEDIHRQANRTCEDAPREN